MIYLLAQNPSPLWLPDTDTLSHLAPMWVLIGTIMAILIGSMIAGRGAKTIAGISLAGALLTAASCFWVFPRVEGGGWVGLAPPDKAPMLLADNFSLFFTLL